MRLFFDIFRQTLATLWAHKLRSFLTMFGIAWGVGSLLLLVGLGEGFRSGNRKRLEGIGQNIMFVFGGRIPAAEGRASAMRPFQLTYDDYLSVKTKARRLQSAAPVIARSDIQMQTDVTSGSGQVMGAVPEFFGIRAFQLKQGRWLNEGDLEETRNIAVINHEVERVLFAGRPALGDNVLLNGQRFAIIGTLKPPETAPPGPPQMQIYIPLTVMRAYFPLKVENGANAISFINYQPHRREEHAAAKSEVRQIIAANHGFDYRVEEAWWDWDTVQSQETVGKIFTAMNWFLGGVGVVTLSLGAISIINIMLVTVAERTPEIGLRKALGATNGNILAQFFLEGACLTLLSGLGGLTFAMAAMRGLDQLPTPPGFDTPQIVPWSAALSIGLLSMCGVIAGLYPARKAALLTPVEALRKD